MSSFYNRELPALSLLIIAFIKNCNLKKNKKKKQTFCDKIHSKYSAQTRWNFNYGAVNIKRAMF